MLEKLLNGEENDEFNMTKNHVLKVKLRTILWKKNALINDKELNDKEYGYYFMNNSKYH